MKFIILAFYCERPWYIGRVIESVLEQDHKDWELFLIDDSTKYPARDHFDSARFGKNKISYIEIGDSEEEKSRRCVKYDSFGGSIFGAYANTALLTTDADYALMLCDDDLLKPDYLSQLNIWYKENNHNYSYCHLEFNNPETGDAVENDYTRYLNGKTNMINPVNELDSSQVSWSVDAWRKNNIQFPWPQTSHLDRTIFEQMHKHWGECAFNGCTGQVKGIHEGQLIHR